MKDRVDQLRSALIYNGALVATPRIDLAPGESLVDAIANAISSCELLVLLISPGDENSRWTKFETQRMLEECWSDPDTRIATIAPAVGAIPKALRHRSFAFYYSHEDAALDQWSDFVRASDFAQLLLRSYSSNLSNSEPMPDEEIHAWRNRIVHIQGSALESKDENEQIRQQLWRELGVRSDLSEAAVSSDERAHIAERLLDRALIAKAIGDESLTAAYYERIGNVLAATPEAEEAPEPDESAYNLGLVAFEAKDYSEAASLFRKARARFAEQYGIDHPATIGANYNLGLTLAQMGDRELAEATYLDALRSAVRVLGPSHPQTNATLTNLGLLYASQGENEIAAEYLERALAGMRKVRPEESNDIKSLQAELDRLR